jgi:hypothetical protein
VIAKTSPSGKKASSADSSRPTAKVRLEIISEDMFCEKYLKILVDTKQKAKLRKYEKRFADYVSGLLSRLKGHDEHLEVKSKGFAQICLGLCGGDSLKFYPGYRLLIETADSPETVKKICIEYEKDRRKWQPLKKFGFHEREKIYEDHIPYSGWKDPERHWIPGKLLMRRDSIFEDADAKSEEADTSYFWIREDREKMPYCYLVPHEPGESPYCYEPSTRISDIDIYCGGVKLSRKK